MCEPTVEQLFSEGLLSDAELVSVAWREWGRDVCFNFHLCKRGTCVLTCEWVANMSIDIHFAEKNGGMPLVWSASCESNDKDIKVLFDFSSSGSIGFNCSKLSVNFGTEKGDGKGGDGKGTVPNNPD